MKMKKIMTFFYNRKRYNMYVGKNNFKYFTELDINGEEKYITLEDYLELYKIFNTLPSLIVKDQKKQGIIPKIIVRGTAVVLTPMLIYTAITMHDMHNSYKETLDHFNSITPIEQEVNDQIDKELEIKDVPDEFVLDTYVESKRLNYTYVYDMDYIDKVINFEPKTEQEFIEVINNNKDISDHFRPLLLEYVHKVFEKYPNVELRPFYQNLKRLKVVECTDEELLKHTHFIDSYGCYVRTENTIYVQKDHEYKPGTWDYQVIFHELSHCLRTSDYKDENNRHIKIQSEGLNYWDVINTEALNSLFTVDLFDYEERDIAYQLQSNYHDIMIECMDNYDLSDYVNHSLSYYAQQLDEFNGDDNYATTILSLIEAQYNDFHSYRTHAEQSEFYPIYDYISNMYFKTHINPSMSYEKAKQLTDQLIERITYDVPDEYNIDTNRFYDNLNNYCNEIGISSSIRK